MSTPTPRRRARISGGLVLAMLTIVAAAPAGTVFAAPEQPRPVQGALEQLADVLGRLEAALLALEAPAAERFEEDLERIIELIEDLLVELDTSQDEADGIDVRARIVKLDLMLHRLLHVLDEIVENAQEAPARPGARAALDDLRHWIDGYVGGATAGMPARETARFERAARDMIRSLSHRLADMARRAQEPDRARPVLARLVDRLEELLFRLDRLLLLRAGSPPSRE